MSLPSGPTIRRAVAADAETLSVLADRLFVQAFVEELGVPYPEADLQAFLQQANGPAVMARRLDDPLTALWIAEWGGEAVGYAQAGPADATLPQMSPADGMLDRLYLAPGWRGRGVAGTMMDRALAWLEDNYSARPWLVVFQPNLRAQRFYARYGFEVVGECEYPVGAWIDHEFVMRRR